MALSPHCIIHLLGRDPRDDWLDRRPRRGRGSHTSRSSRILNSPQIFMSCRSVVITLVRSGGPSKQCPQDLTVRPLLRLGLLPFLFLMKSSSLRVNRLGRTYLPEPHHHHSRVRSVVWEGLPPLKCLRTAADMVVPFGHSALHRLLLEFSGLS
jgi:hypothetical protein